MDYRINIPDKEFYTCEDYAKLPEGAPCQLVGGKLITTPSPTPYHQYISSRIEKNLLILWRKGI
ncbi:MAG: hypothetical protein NUV45_11550 [Tepidanaerobacteraceae bacterium]|jgi:Uma2 family endonuclease|nr:hypothetical protein [Tepidanaerobacteraceae bacterium]